MAFFDKNCHRRIEMKKLTGFILVIVVSMAAHARPFSSAEEMQYLTTTIGGIAQADGFALDNSSLTLESWGSAINTVYNFSPFRLITGPTDDRAYTVYFHLKKGNETYSAKIHFRSSAYPYCSGENNTTVRARSVLNGKENCMALHISPWANNLDKTVTVDSMLSK